MRKKRRVKSLLAELTAQQTEAELVAVLEANVEAIDADFLDEVGGRGQRFLDAGDSEGALAWFTVGAKASRIARLPDAAARFFTSAGFASQRLGEIDEAVAFFGRARDAADQVLGNHTPDTFTAWLAASQQLAFALAEAGRTDLAAAVLREARTKSRDLAEPLGEFAAAMQLVSLHRRTSEPAIATQYARIASDLWSAAYGEVDPRQREDFRVQLAIFLVELAKHAYYEEQDWETAGDLAMRATKLAPDEQAPLFILGMCQIHLEDYEAAVRTWRRTLEIDDELPAHYTNLAQALLGLRRDEEALAVLGESLVRKPNQPRQRLAYAQMLADAQRIGEALDQLDLLEAQLEPHLSQPSPEALQFQSAYDYETNMPLQDIFDFARIARVRVLMDAGRHGEAATHAAELVADGDAPTRLTGITLQGELAEAAGDLDAAVERYTAALEEHPKSTEARKRRAGIAIARDDRTAALADLLVLAEDTEDPAWVIEQADAMLAADPDDPELYKLRGFAHWQSWRPSLAAEDLETARQQLPRDPDLLVWHALNLITYSPNPEEEAWNDGFSVDRIYAAIESLGTAVACDPSHPDAMVAYRWLVDRAETHPAVRMWLYGGGNTEFGVFTLIPGYRELLDRQWEAFAAAEERRWEHAAVEHDRVSEGFEQLGLPVTGARCQINVADNYLRLYELQLAATHLHRARLADLVRGRPLSAELSPMSEELDQQAREDGNVGQAAVEIDYLLVYGLTDQSYDVTLDVLEAQLQTRIGAPDKALEILGDIDALFADPAASLRAGVSFQTLRGAITVLRDAGDLDRALALTEALAPHATSPQEKLGLASTRGTIHDLRGDSDLAAAEYAAAREIARASDGTVVAGLELQYAASLFNSGRPADAEPVLEAVDPSQLTSDNDRQLFHELRARSRGRAGDLGAALSSLDDALGISEQTRAELLSYESRLAWQARQTRLYGRGVSLALEVGDASRAFDYVERAKARGFVDMLANADIALPAEAAHLEAALEKAVARRAVLEELHDAAWLRRSFLDVDLVGRLNELGGHEGLIEPGRTGDVVSAEKLGEAIDEADHKIGRLRSAIEEHRLASAAGARDVTVGMRDVQAMMPNGHGRDAGPPMLLAEYFTTHDAVFIFLLRHDDAAPDVVRIESDADERWETVAQTYGWLVQERTELPAGAADTVAGFVRPILDRARNGEVICLVPHGALHYLPLHAIPVDGTTILEDHPVTYAPSASALALLGGASHGRFASGVVIGDSLGDLPHARIEARQVAGRLGGTLRLGEQATKRRLLDDLARASGEDVLHIACHGFFHHDQALESGVRLAPERGLEGAESVLSAEEVMGRNIAVGLVVLSACETGLNDVRPGEELMGLARAFFAAGAPSVVVSLWSVDDLSTSFLFPRFYELLATGAAKSQALREAALYVRDLTVGEALAILEERDQALGPEEATPEAVVLGRARLYAYGADPSPGSSQTMPKWQAPETAPGEMEPEAASKYAAVLGVDLASDVDLLRRPFAHPYYWAAFLLSGDWR